MRKLRILVKGDNPAGPCFEVLECPICGRFRDSVDIDCKRWRYCQTDGEVRKFFHCVTLAGTEATAQRVINACQERQRARTAAD